MYRNPALSLRPLKEKRGGKKFFKSCGREQKGVLGKLFSETILQFGCNTLPLHSVCEKNGKKIS